ncbi:MAG: ABC transporter ATP-binding protein [Halioglobus sp.]
MKFSSLLVVITPHRRALLAIVGLMLASAAASLMQPWLAGRLTESLLGEAARWGAKDILLLWLVVLVLRSALDFLGQYYTGSVGEQMTARLRSRLFQHMQALPLGYYQQQRKGDVLTLLSNDADIISDFVTHTLVGLLPLLLTFFGAVIMMFLIDPMIAALAAALLPLYHLTMKILGRKIRPLSRSWVDAYSNLVAFLEEHLSMKPAIKSFSRENVEESLFEERNARLLSLSSRQLLLQSLLSPAIGLLAGLGLLMLFWLGSAQIEAELLSPAQLVSLLLYAMLMSQPLRSLANVYGSVQQTRGAAERILQFLGEQTEPGAAGNPDLAPVRGDIRFEGVSFAYPEGNQVLNNFQLEIAAGETVAITGRNGAGKSTIVHLLQRMTCPNQGRIFIDGVDITTVSLTSLRRQIGVVAQHTLLVNGTIAANIAYGSPLVAKSNIEAAARKAHAHDFIETLPQGYQTMIGDQGLKLSGGQRQRISLARTLLVDPPILILDEATSMFDPAGEESFIAECQDLLGGKTVILITHRPTGLDLANRVVELGC